MAARSFLWEKIYVEETAASFEENLDLKQMRPMNFKTICEPAGNLRVYGLQHRVSGTVCGYNLRQKCPKKGQN